LFHSTEVQYLGHRQLITLQGQKPN
jgi:hypothetical protein